MAGDPAGRFRERIRGEVRLGEPLARHTSLRVGGPADFFIAPADLDDLMELLRMLAEQELPWLVAGGGFNLLAGDGGFRGVVISLRELNQLELAGSSGIRAGAGVRTGFLSNFAADNGLAGLEFLSSIPGTVGGALSMNAGAYGDSILERVEVLLTLQDGTLRERGRHELSYGYRHLRLDPGEVILEATFRLDHSSPEIIRQKMEAMQAHRTNSQNVGYPNAGSFFRNPPGKQAWRLIDEAGLRGLRVGNAQVSEVHANFLVNRGGATCRDFIELAGIVKEAVRQKFGIELEEEVMIVGEVV
jgi:UDP-N-acetylmuramate dehydrogenase